LHALQNAVAAAVVLGSGAVALPTSAAAAKSQQAPVAASSPTERYFVQVSARRGELEARLSFHALQLRYPAVLARW
jgi:hypothetical protein